LACSQHRCKNNINLAAKNVSKVFVKDGSEATPTSLHHDGRRGYNPRTRARMDICWRSLIGARPLMSFYKLLERSQVTRALVFLQVVRRAVHNMRKERCLLLDAKGMACSRCFEPVTIGTSNERTRIRAVGRLQLIPSWVQGYAEVSPFCVHVQEHPLPF